MDTDILDEAVTRRGGRNPQERRTGRLSCPASTTRGRTRGPYA